MKTRIFTFRGMSLALLLAPSLLLTAHAAASGARMQPLELPPVAPAVDCATMTAVDVSRAVGAPTVVTAAEIIDAGKPSAVCKLQVVADDYAKFELRLPVSGWTQRLLFGGGFGAQSSSEIMQRYRFATVSWQDLGHRNHEDDFAHNYQYRVNDGYRGQHLQVLASKALIAAYYHQAPKFSYYNACSEPGREGMMEVQRFPEDFDGVGAGCPPINFTINNGLFEAWNVLTNTGADGKPVITADKLPILHEAALDQCDAADGAVDGIISDPFNCHPNLAVVQCKAGDDPSSCLTPAQVGVANELYRGAHDAAGHKLTPIGVLPGSEMAWTFTIIPNPAHNPTEPRDQTTTAIRSQFSDPALGTDWELGQLKFDESWFAAITKLHFLYDATNPDLSGFLKAGHKLILWQGLGDTNVIPAHVILYYQALEKQLGAKAVESFVRLYELPGVNHCGGGDGPIITDFLEPLMLWVERGVAPGALAAAHIPRPAGGFGGPGGPEGQGGPPPAADLTRPVYPYPHAARYTGTGSVREAANFVEGPAHKAPADLSQWLGARFYEAQPLQWCTGDSKGLTCTTHR